MAKPEWGVKRFCTGCGARYYDMRRDPIVCPKCGVTHDPVGPVRPQRPKPAAKPQPAPVPVQADLDVDDSDDDDDLLLDDSDDIDETDDDSDDDEAIEDASELGEDEDDMFEVMDKVEGDKEEER